MNKGNLIVISGPSGGGKGTVVNKLREIMPEVELSISATTRQPRQGEENGREYYFVARDDFEEMVADGDILEFTSYCGNYYGTPKAEAVRITDAGKDLILEIEVDGAAQIKKNAPDAITIMLIPPSLTELEERLRGRGTEAEETISKRLARAREEIAFAHNYDYIVVNEPGKIDECAALICGIIRGERYRFARMTNALKNFLDK